MREYHNPYTGERYVVRVIGFDEALALRKAGAKFYDNTKLVAVNTCPTFGILRYEQHKTETAIGGRNLAIECGSACHDFFAAIRMWTLLNAEPAYKENRMSVNHPINKHGLKLFGFDRWTSML